MTLQESAKREKSQVLIVDPVDPTKGAHVPAAAPAAAPVLVNERNENKVIEGNFAVWIKR